VSQSDNRDTVTRRTFLFQLAAAGIGASAFGACARSAGSVAAVPGAQRIGLQLYTVRDLLDKDFEGTLAKVAQIGYSNLEFAGYYNRTPEQVRALLDTLNVVSRSAHIGANLMRDNAAAQIRSAKIIGQEYITIPSFPFPKDSGIDVWKAAAADFNRWGVMCRDAGIKLAFHNHAAEFAPVAGGPLGYDVLMHEVAPALVDFELDLYWAAFADQSPLALFAKYPGRFTMWHVKDMRVAGTTKSMSPVGAGTIDFKSIFARAGQAGLKYFFVEHDNAAAGPGGSLASVQSSYTYLRQLLDGASTPISPR
jgi:sugar phosphate isomerase/epimerase